MFKFILSAITFGIRFLRPVGQSYIYLSGSTIFQSKRFFFVLLYIALSGSSVALGCSPVYSSRFCSSVALGGSPVYSSRFCSSVALGGSSVALGGSPVYSSQRFFCSSRWFSCI